MHPLHTSVMPGNHCSDCFCLLYQACVASIETYSLTEGDFSKYRPYAGLDLPTGDREAEFTPISEA